jgi:transcription elongation factor GreA
MTPEEYESYGEELGRLREMRDRELPGLFRDARTFVASDVTEEIIQIQKDQAVIGARIGRLQELLAAAQIVDGGAAPGIVTLGRVVEVEYVRTKRVATYLLVGVPPPSGSGAVSAGSPIGAALIGRSTGDIVAVELPNGRVENLHILSVRDGDRAT